MELVDAIASVRNSVVAVMRIRVTRPERTKRGQVQPARFHACFVGTAFCVVDNKFLVTAHHVLNDAKPRNPDDKFYVFSVPQNGPVAHAFPVVAFHAEDAGLDFAILEIGPSQTAGQTIPAVTFSSAPVADGVGVFTCGFPAATVLKAAVGPGLLWLGGEFFLKSHTSEGIVAAQYDLGPNKILEFNVGWFHGESGGPVFSANGSVVAVMQSYRKVQTPDGVVMGPRMGRPLGLVGDALRALGATDAAKLPGQAA